MTLNNYQLTTPFILESGEEISGLNIAYHTAGTLNKSRSNVVWVFHALTANSNVMEWWSGVFGTGQTFNPEEHFIICANVLGSPYGTSAPQGLSFPQFTVRDVVSAHLELAEYLNIQHIQTAVGGSFGGAQALEFAYSFSGKIENLVLVASSAKESAWGIAVHESQRLAIESDPTFGEPGGGEFGMKAARSAALLTYRTSDAFIATQTDQEEKTDDYAAASYIQYQGNKFVKRFNALSYYYLSKCLDSHDIGRARGGQEYALSKIQIPTLVLGITSDGLIPVQLQRFLAEYLPNATYREIDSEYGHDGFLVESIKISQEIQGFLKPNEETHSPQRTVLKFGGTSLANGAPIESVLDIIFTEQKKNPVALVVSAKDDSTDRLEFLYEKALSGEPYQKELSEFLALQCYDGFPFQATEFKERLTEKLAAISVLNIESELVKNGILALGELMSAVQISELLKAKGLKAEFIDTTKLIRKNEDESVDLEASKLLINKRLESIDSETTPVFTGYIVADAKGRISNLGRNGSNYSATLIASFINACEVQNWTNIDGVYSANPKYVKNPAKISNLSFKEANELANFGANILHAKTIKPLIDSNIPLRIKSTLNPEAQGTLVSEKKQGKGMKAVSVIEDVALIKIQGAGLLEQIGIDGRIFSSLSRTGISIRVISQASSERGIGFVVDEKDSFMAQQTLLHEFKEELKKGEISSVSADSDMAIIAILGRHNYSLEKAIGGLRKNRIWLHLISNSISGEHISLVVDNTNLKKAVNMVHNEVFGVIKTLNVFAFGKGTVGGRFLDQLENTSQETEEKRGLKIRLVGVADSKRAVFNENGIQNWEKEIEQGEHSNHPEDVISLLKDSGLSDIVIVDNTSSELITEAYPLFANTGFDLVASNKKGNSASLDFYQNLRKVLAKRDKRFFYETNVGAGLPVIDTLRQLHHSADRVKKVRGVFSGSLSYIFNQFSAAEVPFSKILLEAKEKGFTEPDPREDLSGLDVARKLLILARELGGKFELSDVEVENLVPEPLQRTETTEEFFSSLGTLDEFYTQRKTELKPQNVFRCVGELDMDRRSLRVSLEQFPSDSPIGSIKNADAIIEIFTEIYGEQPMVIQGAGAGAAVTARGVYSDVLRLKS